MSYFTSPKTREEQEATFQILIIQLLLMIIYFMHRRETASIYMTEYMEELIVNSNNFITDKVEKYTTHE